MLKLKKEFKINDFLTLELIDNKTYIIVANERFRQCIYLLLTISVGEVSTFDDIESIDEAIERLDLSLEDKYNNRHPKITPEVEFWAHCSNLQAWAENNYNTRLLQSNLSFPLLKKLTEVGDTLAQQVFKEEIIKRFECGYLPVISYLLFEGYMHFLPDEYFESISFSENAINILFNAINSENSVFKLARLYMFHKLYKYMHKDIIQDFVNVVKGDKDFVNDILYDPAMLTPVWTYFNRSQLYSIRLALILDMLEKKNFRDFCLGELELYDYLENVLNYTLLKDAANLARKSARKEWQSREFIKRV